MNKLQTLLIAGVAAGFAYAAAPAQAVPTYNFEGSDEGGTGSAILDFEISQDLGAQTATIVVEVDNTSPILTDDGQDPNAPAITGFGWDLDPDIAALLITASWELIGFTDTGTAVTIGSSAGGTDWVLGTTQAGVTLDYLPQTVSGVDGALYNPLAVGSSALPGGQNDTYFTTATLTLNLTGVTQSFTIAENLGTSGGGGSPYVRMQNVGRGTEGSLKLVGTPTNGTPVPEPATLGLLGIGLLGAGYWARRRRDDA